MSCSASAIINLSMVSVYMRLSPITCERDRRKKSARRGWEGKYLLPLFLLVKFFAYCDNSKGESVFIKHPSENLNITNPSENHSYKKYPSETTSKEGDPSEKLVHSGGGVGYLMEWPNG